MSLVRVSGYDGSGLERLMGPGDQMAKGDNILGAQITTVGAGTWTGAAIANGIIRRTGPTGGFTDTTDTAANILTAIAGNASGTDLIPGCTFDLVVQNTVAFAHTFAAGTGVIAGTGTLNISASSVRKYIVTVLNTTPVQTFTMSFNSGQTNIYFGTTLGSAGSAPSPVTSFPLVGSNGTVGAVQITPGASVTGTGIQASTTVIGLIQGQAGIIGVTLSNTTNAATTNGSGNVITFGPSVQIDGLYQASL